MALAPDDDLVTHLDANVGALTSGTNLAASPLRPTEYPNIPTQCVFVIASGGPGPTLYLGANSGDDLRMYRVQIMIRSEADEYTNGRDLAKTVYDATHLASISGWVIVRCRDPQPVYLGMQENNLHLWSINVELVGENT